MGRTFGVLKLSKRCEIIDFSLNFKQNQWFPLDFSVRTLLPECSAADTVTAGQVAPPAKTASTNEVEDQVFISNFD